MFLSEEHEKNYKFFKGELPNLLSDPLKDRKYVIIYDEAVKGIYDTFDTAYREACSKFGSGFIIQQAIDESKVDNYLSPAVGI
jgi:hypothetical protein